MYFTVNTSYKKDYGNQRNQGDRRRYFKQTLQKSNKDDDENTDSDR